MVTNAKIKSEQVQRLQVTEDEAGQRIDNYLLARLKGVPKSLVYRIVRKGEVRVNKGRIRPHYRVQAGDEIRVPPIRLNEQRTTNPAQATLDNLEQAILYEDKRLLIINKPSGLAVHGGSGVSYGVIEALRQLRPELKQLELVHRLDRETSGCLVLAKRRSTLRALHELFRENQIDKRYLALVAGAWKGGERRIDAPLKKNLLSSGERVVRVNDQGKQSATVFSPLAVRENVSLLEARLETGRTHQIRVHCSHSGHPIAGDDKYGDRQFNQDMKNYGLKRLFLHAWRIAFYLPDDGGRIDVRAPLPNDLKNVLQRMDINDETLL